MKTTLIRNLIVGDIFQYENLFGDRFQAGMDRYTVDVKYPNGGCTAIMVGKSHTVMGISPNTRIVLVDHKTPVKKIEKKVINVGLVYIDPAEPEVDEIEIPEIDLPDPIEVDG